MSRIVCGLVEELFANKVFLPTMNIVAKPVSRPFFIVAYLNLVKIPNINNYRISSTSLF